jgi:PIN domain nuclease of toxin-antitoxin system
LKLLVDTHAAIWWLAGNRRLSEAARAAIADAGVEAGVSVASIWEASIKRSAGRLKGPDLAAALDAAGLPFLQIDERHAKIAGELPLVHRDPFDRMLVAQALTVPLRLLTHDHRVARYSDTVILV